MSVDDASNSAKAKNYIPADESVSIENQYEQLSKFTMLNGWTEIKSYRDDGYSGGNFQRPGFLEMLEDARHGVIDRMPRTRAAARTGITGAEIGNVLLGHSVFAAPRLTVALKGSFAVCAHELACEQKGLRRGVVR